MVRAEDFHSAIALLVRRLDENTAPENFLRHVFALEPGSLEWITERDRFLAAFGVKAALSEAPHRTQDRRGEARTRHPTSVDERFENDPDTDWTMAANRARIEDVVPRWRARRHDAIPLQIGGEFGAGSAGKPRGAIPCAPGASPTAPRYWPCGRRSRVDRPTGGSAGVGRAPGRRVRCPARGPRPLSDGRGDERRPGGASDRASAVQRDGA